MLDDCFHVVSEGLVIKECVFESQKTGHCFSVDGSILRESPA
jgi:hypothetical protein